MPTPKSDILRRSVRFITLRRRLQIHCEKRITRSWQASTGIQGVLGALCTGLALLPLIVSLRITRVDSDGGTLLRIDGRLEAECVTEFEKACEEASYPLTLDLEGVMWIDDRAADTLRQLIAGGAVMTNASPYIALRLKS